MSKLDISTATAEAIVLMEDLRERLAGHDVSVIGAALGEMVAAYIASSVPRCATRRVRYSWPLLTRWCRSSLRT